MRSYINLKEFFFIFHNYFIVKMNKITIPSRNYDDYVIYFSMDYDGRVIKMMSHELTRKKNQILAALSNSVLFLAKSQVPVQSRTNLTNQKLFLMFLKNFGIWQKDAFSIATPAVFEQFIWDKLPPHLCYYVSKQTRLTSKMSNMKRLSFILKKRIEGPGSSGWN